jgi:four helix bundle protein
VAEKYGFGRINLSNNGETSGEREWGIVAQMRRAVVSVPSNIAEGYGRQSSGSYIQFLSISRGSLLELETQVELCIRLKYLTRIDSEYILNDIMEINKMLTSLISKIK